MSDYKKINRVVLDVNKYNIPIPNAFEGQMRYIREENERTIETIRKAAKYREEEKLRQHNELINTINNAVESGATIVIGDHAGDIQIQQNTLNSNQSMANSSGIDYEQVIAVLNEIQEYYEYPKFDETFKESTETVKQLIDDTVLACQNKEDAGVIKKSLGIIKDITIGTTGSLIASGILALLGQIPF